MPLPLVLLFLRVRSPWDLLLLGNECLLELLNLFLVGNFLAFDLRDHISRVLLWDVLLPVHRLLGRRCSNSTYVSRSARDLWSALHFRWQIPVLLLFCLFKLSLHLLFLLLVNRATHVVVVYVLLR